MWCGFHELVLRNANIAPLLILQDISTANSTATYSIPSSQAFRLDLKFDDGLPYSGNISGTRNAIEAAAGTSTSCTTLVGAETVGANLTPAIVYQINNNIGTGCMTSYLIN
jgi:hypothetical protein